MSQAEVPASPREHKLDTITLEKWVNIPKCIVEAFQKLIDEAKTIEINITNNRELQVVEIEQVEVELKQLRKHMDLTFKDFLEQFKDLKETLNRTLKNISVEISLGNNIGMDNTQKIKDQDQRMLRIEYEARDIREKMGLFEDKSALQKQLKTLGDDVQKKLDSKEIQMKENFNAKITEMLDIPGLVGSGRRFSNVKSLLQHLHENLDKRLGTLKEIVDNKETFFRNGIAEMDLVNKVKAQMQLEIKQNVMKEFETKFETFVKENKAETEALIKKQIKEKAPEPVKPQNSPANEDLIGELFTTIKDLQLRIYFLEHPEQRTPSVDYLDHMMSSSGDINSSQPKLNIDSIIQQPMNVHRDIPNLLLDNNNGRPRSKSESKKKINSEEAKGSDSASKRFNKDFSKDMDRVENSILEEDEENSPRAKLPNIKQIPGGAITSHKTSDADSNSGGNNKAKSGKESSGASHRKMASIKAQSVASNHSSFSKESSGISPQQLGDKLYGKLQKTVNATIAMGRIKRAITTTGKSSQNKLNHSSSRDAEDLNNKSDHFGTTNSLLNQRKKTEPDDRSFTLGDRASTMGNNSPRDSYLPERATKTEVFELNKFDLKNMEPHTVHFLNILEGEFEILRKALKELQGKPAEGKPSANMATTKIPEIQTRPRQASFSGARITLGDKEALMMNTSTNMTQQQQGKKTSAYQMLKTVEKLKEEEERAWALAHPQPQQSGPQKYPLTQIRANGQNGGLKVSEISGANSAAGGGQTSSQLTRMPTIPVEAQNKLNSIPLTNSDRKEYTSAEVFKETTTAAIETKPNKGGNIVTDSAMNTKVVLKNDVKSPEQGERPHQPQLKGTVGGSKSPEKRRRAVTNFGGHH